MQTFHSTSCRKILIHVRIYSIYKVVVIVWPLMMESGGVDFLMIKGRWACHVGWSYQCSTCHIYFSFHKFQGVHSCICHSTPCMPRSMSVSSSNATCTSLGILVRSLQIQIYKNITKNISYFLFIFLLIFVMFKVLLVNLPQTFTFLICLWREKFWKLKH